MDREIDMDNTTQEGFIDASWNEINTVNYNLPAISFITRHSVYIDTPVQQVSAWFIRHESDNTEHYFIEVTQLEDCVRVGKVEKDNDDEKYHVQLDNDIFAFFRDNGEVVTNDRDFTIINFNSKHSFTDMFIYDDRIQKCLVEVDYLTYVRVTRTAEALDESKRHTPK